MSKTYVAILDFHGFTKQVNMAEPYPQMITVPFPDAIKREIAKASENEKEAYEAMSDMKLTFKFGEKRKISKHQTALFYFIYAGDDRVAEKV